MPYYGSVLSFCFHKYNLQKLYIHIRLLPEDNQDALYNTDEIMTQYLLITYLFPKQSKTHTCHLGTCH